jgi:hypothetical protein
VPRETVRLSELFSGRISSFQWTTLDCPLSATSAPLRLCVSYKAVDRPVARFHPARHTDRSRQRTLFSERQSRKIRVVLSLEFVAFCEDSLPSSL